MQVRAEAVAGEAMVPDCLALADGAARDDAGEVRVGGREAAAVVDDDQVSVAAHPAGVDDGAARRGHDTRAVWRGDVDPLVHATPAPAEAACHRAGNRPDQPAGRRRAVRGRRRCRLELSRELSTSRLQPLDLADELGLAVLDVLELVLLLALGGLQ